MDYEITLSDQKWNAIMVALDNSSLPHKFVVDLAAEIQAQAKIQEETAKPKTKPKPRKRSA